MKQSNFGQWRPMASAPRDGTRVLVAMHASEQGPADVDVARWTHPKPAREACWVASDSSHDCMITYEEAELAFWMPLPASQPQHRAAYSAAALPPIPSKTDEETGGSGI
jgi:hypothetical protein